MGILGVGVGLLLVILLIILLGWITKKRNHVIQGLKTSHNDFDVHPDMRQNS